MREKPDEIRRAIEEFAKDSYKIRKNVRKAGESVIENISRHAKSTLDLAGTSKLSTKKAYELLDSMRRGE